MKFSGPFLEVEFRWNQFGFRVRQAYHQGKCLVAKSLCSKSITSLCDIILFTYASVFSLDKIFHFGKNEYLTKYLTKEMVDRLVDWAGWLLVVVSVFKLLSLFFDKFPIVGFGNNDRGALLKAVDSLSRELKRYLEIIIAEKDVDIKMLDNQLIFSQQISSVLEDAAAAVRLNITGVSLGDKDVFMSFYLAHDFDKDPFPNDGQFVYITHLGANFTNYIASSRVNIHEKAFEDYEFSKLVKGKETERLVVNCLRYAQSQSGRSQTVRHYIGMKFAVEGKAVAVLSVEIHNRHVFYSESSMKEFFDKTLLPYCRVIECYLLKRKIVKISIQRESSITQAKIIAGIRHLVAKNKKNPPSAATPSSSTSPAHPSTGSAKPTSVVVPSQP